MSELAEKLQAVLDAHIAEDGGGFVTAWHLVADYIDSDGDHSWIHSAAPEQQLQVTMGLLQWANGLVTFEQQRYLDEITES